MNKPRCQEFPILRRNLRRLQNLDLRLEGQIDAIAHRVQALPRKSPERRVLLERLDILETRYYRFGHTLARWATRLAYAN